MGKGRFIKEGAFQAALADFRGLRFIKVEVSSGGILPTIYLRQWAVHVMLAS